MPTSSAEGQSGSTLDAIRQRASGGTLAERLDFEFWYRLRTIFRVAESPYLLLDLATFICTGLLIAFALWKGWMRLHRWCWPALIGLILLCAAMPPSLFGVGYVSDRIPLVVALLLVSALPGSEERKSVVCGKSVSVRVDPGGRLIIKNTTNIEAYRRITKQ